MAYEIVFKEGNKQITAHSPVNKSIKLTDMNVSLSTGRMDHMGFTISPNNPAYYFINEMKTVVQLINEQKEIEFEGRVLSRVGKSAATTIERSYKVEDVIGYLHDIMQKALSFKGKPSELFKKIMERYNSIAEPHKQFAVGVCEVDTFIEYIEGSTGTNLLLNENDKATIKPTATVIRASWDGPALNMANYIKGVTLIVDAREMVGGTVRYLLYRMVNGVKIVEGIVNAEDIVETYITITKPNTVTASNMYPSDTQVRLKKGVSIYYRSSDGSGSTVIPTNKNGLNYRELNYTIRDASEKYKRYSIAYKGEVVGWANEADLDFGAIAKPSQPYNRTRPNYVERQRIIEAELDYQMSTWKAIDDFLLKPYGAEIEWEYIEGVRTINIRNIIQTETNEELRVGLNLISMQESLNPTDIVTVVLPIGRLAKDE